MVKVNTEMANGWSNDEIVSRWRQLFAGSELLSRYMAGDCVSQAESDKAQDIIDIWRERLVDISWMMRCLNESIARKANKEDNYKGRFWEGRFKCQALLDVQALLACMVYVDLNPIRAGITQTLANSEYTSIQQRIIDYGNHTENKAQSHNDFGLAALAADEKTIKLNPFAGDSDHDTGIPYGLNDYFELNDWTGRAIIDGKRGHIP